MFQKAVEEYVNEANTTAEELLDLQFVDAHFESLSEDDMKVLASYPNLEFVNFANVGLKSVSSQFPSGTKISCVSFSNCELGNDVLPQLTTLSELRLLGLDGNNISSLDKFEVLAGLTELREIALDGCPVTETDPDYRTKLFQVLPQLQLVDEIDREGNIVEDDEDCSSCSLDHEDDSSDEDDDEDEADFDEEDEEGDDAEEDEDDDDDDDDDEEDDSSSSSPSNKKVRQDGH